MTPPVPSPVRRFFGAALIGVGFMMMLLCGGCGAVFLVSFVVSTLLNGGGMATVLAPILLGGLPALIGLGLLRLGRRFQR